MRDAGSRACKLWLHCAGLEVSGAAITTVDGLPNTQSVSFDRSTPAMGFSSLAHFRQSQAKAAAASQESEVLELLVSPSYHRPSGVMVSPS